MQLLDNTDNTSFSSTRVTLGEASGDHSRHVPQLDDLIRSRSEQAACGGLIVHVNNVVLAVVKRGRGRSVLVGDGSEAAVTDSHLELEAH